MRAAIYIRVSDPRQVERYSLDTQEKICRDFCERRDWAVDAVFREEGESAKTADRPQLQAMLSHLRKRKDHVQFVVVLDLSRFARSNYDYQVIKRFLGTLGISLRAALQEAVDDTPEGEMMGDILAAVNQYDNRARARKSLTGMKEALGHGRWTFRAPIGFLNFRPIDGRKTLILDPQRAPLVREAFQMMATGAYTRGEVLERVTQLGLRSRRGKPLTHEMFSALLRKPLYCGRISVGGELMIERQSEFEPIVTPEVFEQVQRVLGSRTRTVAPHKRSHPDFPLRRFVRCGHCDKPLTGGWSRGKSGARYAYYFCPKCGAVNARRQDLEQAFLLLLDQLRPRPEAIALVKEAVLEKWRERQANAAELRRSIEQRLHALKERKNRLTEAFIFEKAIDKESYQHHLDKLNQDIALAELECHDAQLDEIDLEGTLAYAERIALNAARLWAGASLENRQRLQQTLFPDGVVYGDEGFRTRVTAVRGRRPGPLDECATSSCRSAGRLTRGENSGQAHPPSRPGDDRRRPGGIGVRAEVAAALGPIGGAEPANDCK